MDGKRIHLQKPNLFVRGRCACPASDRRTPRGRALCPVEAAVSCVELDPAKRPTQGHDLPGAPVGFGTQGRHPSSPNGKDSFQEPFPGPKPAGEDRDRPKPHRETVAGPFSYLDSPGEKKPFGETVQQPHRGASLFRVFSASRRASQVHGSFRGTAGGMSCLLLRSMASGAAGSFHRVDSGAQRKESPFACLQHPILDHALGPGPASCIASFGPMFETAFQRLANALFSSCPLG